ncbi:MAG: hypothetical protein ACRC5R_03055, partial [Mycoplasmatales bacterium]
KMLYDKTNGFVSFENYNDNYYRSVNSFKKSRRKSDVFELLRFYIDLDVYSSRFLDENKDFFDSLDNKINKDYSNLEQIMNIRHDFVKQNLFKYIKKINLPEPSEIVFSGRGYYLYWNIKNKNEPTTEEQKQKYKTFYGVPKFLLNSYELVETNLVNLFDYFGADKKATDVSRLLRVEETINQKSFLLSTTIYKSNNYYLFEEIADCVLPYSYNQVLKHKTEFKPITDRQKSNLLNAKNKEIIKGVDIEKLSSKEASALINESMNINLNKKYKYDNKKYIINLLDKALKLGFIREGNRNIFYYYYGIGYKRNYDEIQDIGTIEKNVINKLNKKIQLDENEALNSFKSGLNSKTTNITKKQINASLGLNKEQIERIKKPKGTRNTKRRVKEVYMLMKARWRVEKNVPISALVKKYNLAQGSIQKIKKSISLFFEEQTDNTKKYEYILRNKNEFKIGVHKKKRKSSKCSSCGGLSRVEIYI